MKEKRISIQRMEFESFLKSSQPRVETPQVSRPGSPGTSKTFSFLAPHYKDFTNDVTLGEGDSFFGTISLIHVVSSHYYFFRSNVIGIFTEN
jgi:hypothetical protein